MKKLLTLLMIAGLSTTAFADGDNYDSFDDLPNACPEAVTLSETLSCIYDSAEKAVTFTAEAITGTVVGGYKLLVWNNNSGEKCVVTPKVAQNAAQVAQTTAQNAAQVAQTAQANAAQTAQVAQTAQANAAQAAQVAQTAQATSQTTAKKCWHGMNNKGQCNPDPKLAQAAAQTAQVAQTAQANAAQAAQVAQTAQTNAAQTAQVAQTAQAAAQTMQAAQTAQATAKKCWHGMNNKGQCNPDPKLAGVKKCSTESKGALQAVLNWLTTEQAETKAAVEATTPVKSTDGSIVVSSDGTPVVSAQ